MFESELKGSALNPNVHQCLSIGILEPDTLTYPTCSLTVRCFGKKQLNSKYIVWILLDTLYLFLLFIVSSLVVVSDSRQPIQGSN